MDDEILVRCSALKITEEEEDVIALDNISTDVENPSMNLALVGKVMTVRPYNFEAFKRTMNQIWAISKHALFRSIENGLFVIQFATLRDKTKVLEGRPWTFDQHLIAMDEIEGALQPSEIALDWSPLWVRLYNLQMDSRTEKHVCIIGNNIGSVMEIDSDGIDWDSSARLRVMVNITKPLRRIIKVRNSSGRVVLVEVKYERLPIFCFGCGKIGHMEKDCDEAVEDENEGEKQWGAWLKASPRKGGLKKRAEAKTFLASARSLQFSRPMKKGVNEGDDEQWTKGNERCAKELAVRTAVTTVSRVPVEQLREESGLRSEDGGSLLSGEKKSPTVNHSPEESATSREVVEFVLPIRLVWRKAGMV